MARNASGTYALPAGNPVVTGTTIQSTWANTTLSDIATEMTDSLDRSGKGGMLAALLHTDGTVAAPSLSFNNETNSGFYRAAAGDVRLSVIGTDIMKANAGLVSVLGANGLAVGTAGAGTLQAAVVTAVGTANQSLTLRGNRTAADAGTDFVLTSLAARTAGLLFDVQNNGSTVLNIANGASVAGSTVQVAANFLSFTGSGPTITASAANASLTLRGNRAAADAGTDFILTSLAARTAGKLFDVQNNGTSVLSLTNAATVDASTLTLVPSNFTLSGTTPTIAVTAADTGLVLQGNRNAGSVGGVPDVEAVGAAVRTAGYIFGVRSGGSGAAKTGFCADGSLEFSTNANTIPYNANPLGIGTQWARYATPRNMVSLIADLTIAAAGAVTFPGNLYNTNVTATWATTDLNITFLTALTHTNYAVLVNFNGTKVAGEMNFQIVNKLTTGFTVRVFNSAGTLLNWTATDAITVVVIGGGA